MNLIIILLAMISITTLLKESELLSKPRSWLISKHPFFYDLFSCAFCVGFYSGLIVYVLTFDSFNIRQLILFGFVGSIISLMFNMIMDKFFSIKTNFKE